MTRPAPKRAAMAALDTRGDPTRRVFAAELACVDAARALEAAAQGADPALAFRLRFTAGVIRLHVGKIMPSPDGPDAFERFQAEKWGHA